MLARPTRFFAASSVHAASAFAASSAACNCRCCCVSCCSRSPSSLASAVAWFSCASCHTNTRKRAQNNEDQLGSAASKVLTVASGSAILHCCQLQLQPAFPGRCDSRTHMHSSLPSMPAALYSNAQERQPAVPSTEHRKLHQLNPSSTVQNKITHSPTCGGSGMPLLLLAPRPATLAAAISPAGVRSLLRPS